MMDRLQDDTHDSAAGGYFSMHQLRDAVQQDLQNLLNTRVRFLSPDKDLKDAQDSIFNYGLPDLTSQNLNSESGREEFASWIERTIRRFEPRFKSVTVTPIERGDAEHGAAFRVDAVLYADPAPEDVSFDSVIDPFTQDISVRETLR